MNPYPPIASAGDEPANTAVRRRRRNRILALVLFIAAVVLAPMAAFASLGPHHSPATPPAASSTATLSAPPPSAQAASSPPSPGTSPVRTAPNAPTDLNNATLTIPAWTGANESGCPSGPVTFNGGRAQPQNKDSLTLQQSAAVDVDRDGGTETVVIVRCLPGPTQVIAVKAHRDGSLSTLARVTRSSFSDAQDTVGVSSAPNGRVAVTVGDIGICCETPRAQQITQVRTFAYQNGTFHQTAGPTTFSADTSYANVTATAPTVTFADTEGSAGTRMGTLTVTATNHGPHPASSLTLLVGMPLATPDSRSQGSWDRCQPLGGDSVQLCQIGSLGAGSSITLTLPLVVAGIDVPNPVPANGDVGWNAYLQPRTGSQKYAETHVKMLFS